MRKKKLKVYISLYADLATGKIYSLSKYRVSQPARLKKKIWQKLKGDND